MTFNCTGCLFKNVSMCAYPCDECLDNAKDVGKNFIPSRFDFDNPVDGEIFHSRIAFKMYAKGFRDGHKIAIEEIIDKLSE